MAIALFLVLSYFFSNVRFFGSDGILKKKKHQKISFLNQNKTGGKNKITCGRFYPKVNPKMTIRVYSSEPTLQNKLGLERWVKQRQGGEA